MNIQPGDIRWIEINTSTPQWVQAEVIQVNEVNRGAECFVHWRLREMTWSAWVSPDSLLTDEEYVGIAMAQ